MSGELDHDNVHISLNQAKVLAILPIPSAILSVIGSSLIIYMALKSRQRGRWTPYTRLLFGLSVCEIIYSITAALAQYMRQKEACVILWSIGNEASCTAIGFFNQFSISTRLYYGMISFYYLLSARFGISNATIAGKQEIAMHTVALGFPLITAITGAAMGVFGESATPMGCFIGQYPKNCGGEDGVPCMTKTIGSIFYLIPAFLVMLVVLINNVVIWMYVRKQTRPVLSFRSGSTTRKTKDKISSVLATAKKKKSSRHVGISLHPRAIPKKAPSSRRAFYEEEKEQIRRLKLVRSQAILYVSTYFLGNIWTAILILAETVAENDMERHSTMTRYFYLTVLQATLCPLQGFLNFFVYLRPKYLRCKRDFPLQSSFWLVRRSIFGDETPPVAQATPASPGRRRATMDGASTKEQASGSGDLNHVVMVNVEGGTPNIATPLRKGMVSSLSASNGDFDDIDNHSYCLEERDNSKNRPCSTPTATRIPKGMVSSLSASDGDFDGEYDAGDDYSYNLEDMEQNKKKETGRWAALFSTRAEPEARFQSSYSSFLTATSLDVISETMESIFEPMSFAQDDTDSSATTAENPPSDAESRWASCSVGTNHLVPPQQPTNSTMPEKATLAITKPPLDRSKSMDLPARTPFRQHSNPDFAEPECRIAELDNDTPVCSPSRQNSIPELDYDLGSEYSSEGGDRLP